MPQHDAPKHATPYNQEELDHFKKLLKDEQEQTQQRLEEAKDSIERLSENKGQEYSSSTHHIGDMGSKVEEKETEYKLIGRNEDKLNEIKAALDRIEQGTYGICEDTGKKIKKGRLEAKPWTRYSMEAEKGGEDKEATTDW
ncbi:MAG TPA: TraR/DksA C4-type zinc finger protein [Balneolaceae bacterium]|nr:TraR/DksA C4-type zinc finger protein [Balneolaceae bacterium]